MNQDSGEGGCSVLLGILCFLLTPIGIIWGACMLFIAFTLYALIAPLFTTRNRHPEPAVSTTHQTNVTGRRRTHTPASPPRPHRHQQQNYSTNYIIAPAELSNEYFTTERPERTP